MTLAIEPWLREASLRHGGRAVIVGKGPSAAELDRGRLAGHFVIGLNEVPLKLPCDAGFVIDEDIPLAHGAALVEAVHGTLIVPRVMHHRTHQVGGLTVYGPNPQQVEDAAWRRVAGDRLRRFNLSSAPKADPALGEVYPAFNFSAPTLANLLAACGFERIVLCGVDGGARYASDFKAFEHKKLASIQKDFDIQFEELRGIRERYGTSFASARCLQPHVLIGTEPEQCLAREVLRWSIDRNSFLDLNYLEPGSGMRDLYAKGAAGTPFSLQRLELPALAKHQGRGVYFDSDMLVFDDIYELFNMDMHGQVLLSCQPTPGRAPQYSVFLVDNERAHWDAAELARRLVDGTVSYAALLHEFEFAHPKEALIDWRWNSLERYEVNLTANIHFTDMDRQPWLSTTNPHTALWCEALLSALHVRQSVREALDLSIDRGWVRPSLRWQVERAQADPWAIPRAVLSADNRWVPPHVALKSSATPWLTRSRWRWANRWRKLRRSPLSRRTGRAYDALAKILASGRTP